MNAFIKRYIIEPPVFFPLAVLFHLFLLGSAVFTFSGETPDAGMWLKIAWLALALIFTIFICAFKKWAALGYILLTGAGLAVQYFTQAHDLWHYAAQSAFPFDVIYTSLILFFFKRFQ